MLAMRSNNRCDDDMSSGSTTASASTTTIDDCPVPNSPGSDDDFVAFNDNDIFGTDNDVYEEGHQQRLRPVRPAGVQYLFSGFIKNRGRRIIQLGWNAFTKPCCHAIRKRRIINIKKRHIQTPPAVLKRRSEWNHDCIRHTLYSQRWGKRDYTLLASVTRFHVKCLMKNTELPIVTKAKIKTEHEEIRRKCSSVINEWKGLIRDTDFKWRSDNWLIERHMAFVILQFIRFNEKVEFILRRYGDFPPYRKPLFLWCEEYCVEILGW